MLLKSFQAFVCKKFLNLESAHINDTVTKEDDLKLANDQFQRGFYWVLYSKIYFNHHFIGFSMKSGFCHEFWAAKSIEMHSINQIKSNQVSELDISGLNNSSWWSEYEPSRPYPTRLSY